MTAIDSAIHLSSRALIAVAGPDWQGFLQGLLTNDVVDLKAGELRFCGLLTPQGRLLYDLFVIPQGEGALLDVEAAHRDDIIRRLSMYRLRARVEIAADGRAVGATLTSGIADPRLPALGFRTYGAPAGGDEAAYEAHRLSLGVPGPADWGVDHTYPIEANFDLLNGIDFKKGCFVGQETTSRMHRRGQTKSRMLPIAFDGAAPPTGAEVLRGELRAGVVRSGIDGRAIALLRLDRIDGDLTVDGRPVTVEHPGWFAP